MCSEYSSASFTVNDLSNDTTYLGMSIDMGISKYDTVANRGFWYLHHYIAYISP